MDSHMNKLTSRMAATFRNCMVALIVLLAFHAPSANSQQDKWLDLGKGQVSKASSSSYIPLDTGKGTVCALRFQQQGAGLEIEQVNVRFGNSQSMHLSLQKTISLGGTDFSSSVHLGGNRRTVSGVEIVYKLLD